MGEEERRRFDVRKQGVKAVVFEVETVDRKGKTVVHEFHCLPAMGNHAIKEFSRLNGANQFSEAAETFIEKCLIEDDRPSWRRLMEDPYSNVTSEELSGIFAWLQEQYSDRPTQPSNGSAVGRKTTEGGSTESSSSPVTTQRT